MQASAVGAASFGARSRGRAGAATFGRLPDGWEALVAGSDVLAAAAEVVLGRRDLLDLTASGMPDDLAHEVRTTPSPYLCIGGPGPARPAGPHSLRHAGEPGA